MYIKVIMKFFLFVEMILVKYWYLFQITPKLKELLTLSSRLMIAYTPLRHHKNFFRLAFTFHPVVEENHVLEILKSIEECGEMVNTDMV